MSVLGWILLGLIAGFIGSKIVNHTGQGLLLDIVLGIVGAVVGGFLFTAVGATGITGFNLYSMFVAVVGAVVVLWGYHGATRGVKIASFSRANGRGNCFSPLMVGHHVRGRPGPL